MLATGTVARVVGGAEAARVAGLADRAVLTVVAIAVCLPGAPVLVPGATGRPVAVVEEVRRACHAALAPVVRSSGPLHVVGTSGCLAPGEGPRRVDAPTSAGLGAYGLPAKEHSGLPAGEHGVEPGDSAACVPSSIAIACALIAEASRLTASRGGAEPGRELVGWVLPEDGPLAMAAATAAQIGAHDVVIVADGSARRGQKPPRDVHADAEAFDSGIAHALRSGDGDALRAVDAAACRTQSCVSRLAWAVMGEWLAGWSERQAQPAAASQQAVTHNATGPCAAAVHYEGAPLGVGYAVASWTISAGNEAC